MGVGEIVRAARAAFVAKEAAAAPVTSTDNYSYPDPWHYATPGYFDLGRKSAERTGRIAGGGAGLTLQGWRWLLR